MAVAVEMSSDVEQLLTEHQERLYAFIHALVGDAAGDVLQETNRALWEKRADFDPGRDFLPWALAFARNQVRAARTRMRRDRLAFDDAAIERVADRLSQRAAGHDRRQAALSECLQELSDEQRHVVERRYARHETVEQVAAATGRSAGAVAVAVFRLRQALARCIEARLRREAP